MRTFQWTPANDVFAPSIDDGHHTICQITGELQLALRGRTPLFKVQEILHRLISGMEDHFAYEEKLMHKTRYFSLTWHKGQHDAVRKRMRILAPLIEIGDVEAGKELVAILTRWLEDHTNVADRMLGAHLRNHERSLIR